MAAFSGEVWRLFGARGGCFQQEEGADFPAEPAFFSVCELNLRFSAFPERFWAVFQRRSTAVFQAEICVFQGATAKVTSGAVEGAQTGSLGNLFSILPCVFFPSHKTVPSMERDSEDDCGGNKFQKASLQDLADKPVKVPTLWTFPLDRQLTGTNFSIWKVIMLAVLESYELAFFSMTDVPKPAEEDEGALWDRINARIRSFIILNVTPAILSHIKHMTDAKAIWTHLASLYERVSPMKRVSLEVQMRMLDPSKSSSMQEHINKLQGLQQEVLSMGKKISSEDMAITLLSHLPVKYSNFYSSLITSGHLNEVTWEELVPMLLDQEEHFQQQVKDGSPKALAGGPYKGKGKSQQQNSEGREGNQQSRSQKTKEERDALMAQRYCNDCGAKGATVFEARGVFHSLNIHSSGASSLCAFGGAQ